MGISGMLALSKLQELFPFGGKGGKEPFTEGEVVGEADGSGSGTLEKLAATRIHANIFNRSVTNTDFVFCILRI